MLNKLRDKCCDLFLYLPPVARRLDEYLAINYPIMYPAFQQDNYAQYLTLRFFDYLAVESVEQTGRVLQKLRGRCRSRADEAFCCFLEAQHRALQEDTDGMIAALQKTNELGHSFAIVHFMLGEALLYDRGECEEALESFALAAQCTYDAPPLDEPKLALLGTIHAMTALALTLLRRTDEARDALRKAEKVSGSEEYCHAQAMYHALLRHEAETAEALRGLRKVNEPLHDHILPLIRQLLNGEEVDLLAPDLPIDERKDVPC